METAWSNSRVQSQMQKQQPQHSPPQNQWQQIPQQHQWNQSRSTEQQSTPSSPSSRVTMWLPKPCPEPTRPLPSPFRSCRGWILRLKGPRSSSSHPSASLLSRSTRSSSLSATTWTSRAWLASAAQTSARTWPSSSKASRSLSAPPAVRST